MPEQTMTLIVPDTLYDRLRQRAEQNRRSVEAETLEVLAAHVQGVQQLPDDLAQALAPLALLDDEALWRAARNRMTSEATAQMEHLHVKRQRNGLTEVESQALTVLERQYEHAMLVRSQAAALLQGRGHNVDSLLVAS
jgi:plasmid stability protein